MLYIIILLYVLLNMNRKHDSGRDKRGEHTPSTYTYRHPFNVANVLVRELRHQSV